MMCSIVTKNDRLITLLSCGMTLSRHHNFHIPFYKADSSKQTFGGTWWETRKT